MKKGQFLAPEDTTNIIDKVSPVLERKQFTVIERGTSFGYNNLVVDMASYNIMKSFGVKVIHDATPLCSKKCLGKHRRKKRAN